MKRNGLMPVLTGMTLSAVILSMAGQVAAQPPPGYGPIGPPGGPPPMGPPGPPPGMLPGPPPGPPSGMPPPPMGAVPPAAPPPTAGAQQGMQPPQAGAASGGAPGAMQGGTAATAPGTTVEGSTQPPASGAPTAQAPGAQAPGAQTPGAQIQGGGTQDLSAASQGGGLQGEHSMSGIIAHKDSATGNVRLSTAEGSLGVHFPPQSLADVQDGDRITVLMGFSKDTAAAGQLSAPPDIQLQGQHSVTGTVSQVDNQQGKLTLNTQEGALDLHFPPQSLADVRQGDTLNVQMAYAKGEITGGAQQGGVEQGAAGGSIQGGVSGGQPQ